MVAAIDKPKVVSSARELGIALSVSTRQVQRYLADGMPGSPGRYYLDECREWVAANIQSQGDDGGDLNSAKKRAEIRKLNAEAEAKEMKNRQARGELAAIDDVLQAIAERDIRIKTRLESLPDEIEMRIPSEVRADVKKDVCEYVRLVLKEMAASPLVEIPDADFDPE